MNAPRRFQSDRAAAAKSCARTLGLAGLAGALFSVALRAQAAPPPAASPPTTPPSTDIYLAPLTTRAGKLVVGAPTNVTKRPGYDNQPSFTPDGRALLFTSVREDAQADIYRYDLRTRTTSRVTATPESEYSASVYGDGSRFSVIRVELDSTQRLWSFRLDGSDPRLVLESVKPVGYHAWVDASTVALFILGSPNTLLVADVLTGRADTIARDVGRSLAPLPRGGGFSFTQRLRDSSWALTAVDVRRSKTTGARHSMVLPVARMARGADYVAWVTPSQAISGAESKLLLWTRERGPLRWAELADLSRQGLRRISRLAISADRRWLAIVAEPASGTR